MANDSDTTDTNADDSGNSKAEIFLELAKLSEQSIEKRKDIEWKVGFGFWTAIIVATVFLTQNAGSLPGCFVCWLGTGYLVAFLVWTCFWQAPLHTAFDVDKKWKHYYAGQAEGRDTPPRPAQDDGDKSNWERFIKPISGAASRPWFWGQVLMTAVFLLLSFLVIDSAQNTSKMPQPKTTQDQLSVSGENVRFILDKMSP